MKFKSFSILTILIFVPVILGTVQNSEQITGCQSFRDGLAFTCDQKSNLLFPSKTIPDHIECEFVDWYDKDKKTFVTDNITSVAFIECEIEKVPFEVVDSFKNLTELEFNFKQRRDSKYDGSNDTTYLNPLELTSSFIGNVPQLKTFFLMNKNISRIDPMALESVKKLEAFILANNSISTIPANLFHGMANLRIIALIKNNFEEVPKIEKDESHQIKWLFLNENQIPQLTIKTFENLTDLQLLELDLNKIESIEPGSFIGMNKLILLDLSLNPLKKISKEMFEGLTHLVSLGLGECGLEHLDSDVFNALTNLKSLSLSSNNITTLDDHLFDGLHKLTTLYLSGNKISDLNIHMFANLVNLEKLNLDRNRLTKLDFNLLAYLPHLEYLDVYANNISQLIRCDPNNKMVASTGAEFQPRDNHWKDEIAWIESLGIFASSMKVELRDKLGEVRYLGPRVFNESGIRLRYLMLSDNQLTNIDEFIFDDFKYLQVFQFYNR